MAMEMSTHQGAEMETFAEMFTRVTAAVESGEMTAEQASEEMVRAGENSSPPPFDPEQSALARTGNFNR